MRNGEQTVRKVFILGLPNTGKSLIFTNLTGQFTIVANAPLTTISMKKASVDIDDRSYEIVDTPGLHSLYIDSEEQIRVRNAIFRENPDVIIQCIDANRLKQSLILTTDLLELGIPMVISLNAVDETLRKGIWIDSDGLSRQLGVPVVESMALQARGTRALLGALQRAAKGNRGISYGTIIESSLASMGSRLPADLSYKRIISLLMLMNDPLIAHHLEETSGKSLVASLTEEADRIRRQFKGSIHRVVNNCRGRWVDDVVAAITRKPEAASRELSETLARLTRHPLFGIPILVLVLYLMFFLVVNVANVLADLMNAALWGPVEETIAGIAPKGFWHDFLIGHYGILSLGLANAVLTVLPILSVFFVMFGTLEDVGYIPNLSVLSKRLLGKLGLSGNAIMPLVLAFGCKTMATMTTRNLQTEKERYIAIYLIAFAIPCAAQMGLNMSILGHIGSGAFFIAFSVLVTMEVLAGVILNRMLKEQEERMGFILELPPIRMPNVRGVLKKTYYRLYWFLRESLLVFVYAALVLFAMDILGVLEVAKKLVSPVVEGFLGLPLDMTDAIILCLARHEAAAGMIITLIRNGQLNHVQCIVAVVLTTMFVPCFANIMAMIKEAGLKNALAMVLAINISAFIVAGILNAILVTLYGGV